MKKYIKYKITKSLHYIFNNTKFFNLLNDILVLSSVITCSYAFMSPVASPPNAIAYAASTMSPRDMASTGFMMNIICVITTTFAINSYGVVMFDLNNFPTWAKQFIPSSQNITCNV